MAKELTAADVAAFLAANGMGVPEELSEKIENEKEDAAFHAIVKVLDENVSDETETATDIQKRLFDLASVMSSDIRSERNNVGRGQADQHKVTVETHFGTLFVRLSTTVVESEK